MATSTALEAFKPTFISNGPIQGTGASAASTVGSTAGSTAASVGASTLLGPAMIMFQILSGLRSFNQKARNEKMQVAGARDAGYEAQGNIAQAQRDADTLARQGENDRLHQAQGVASPEELARLNPSQSQPSALSQFGVPSVSSAGNQMASPGGQFGMPNVSQAVPSEGSGVGQKGTLSKLNTAKQTFDMFGMFNKKKKEEESPMQQFDMSQPQGFSQDNLPQDPYVSQVGGGKTGMNGGTGQSAVGKLRSDMDLVRLAMSKGSYAGRM